MGKGTSVILMLPPKCSLNVNTIERSEQSPGEKLPKHKNSPECDFEHIINFLLFLLVY